MTKIQRSVFAVMLVVMGTGCAAKSARLVETAIEAQPAAPTQQPTQPLFATCADDTIVPAELAEVEPTSTATCGGEKH